MDKKVFIDFGSGSKLKNCMRFYLKDYYVIAVNQYEKDLIEYAETFPSIEYCDELLFFDLSDLSNVCTYKADAWNCSAVLEHVEEHKIENFLTNINNNTKDISEGRIQIDLTDHEGGFKHYEYPSQYSFIKNTLKENDWNDLIKKHFNIVKQKKRYDFHYGCVKSENATSKDWPTAIFYYVSKK